MIELKIKNIPKSTQYFCRAQLITVIIRENNKDKIFKNVPCFLEDGNVCIDDDKYETIFKKAVSKPKSTYKMTYHKMTFNEIKKCHILPNLPSDELKNIHNVQDYLNAFVGKSFELSKIIIKIDDGVL